MTARRRRAGDAALTAGARALDVLADLEPLQLLRDLRRGYATGVLNPLPPRNLVPEASFVETHPAETVPVGPPPRPLDPTYPYGIPADGVVRRGPHGYWRLPGASWYAGYGLVVAGPHLEMVEGCYRFPLRHTRVADARHRRRPPRRFAGIGVPLEAEYLGNHYHNLFDHGPRLALLAHPHFQRFDDIQVFTYSVDTNPVLAVLAERLLPPNARLVRVDPDTLVQPDELLLPLPPMGPYDAVPPRWYLDALASKVSQHRQPPDRLVYISRTGAAKRAIRNEEDIVERLRQRGFEIVRPETLDPAAVIDLMGRTRLLVGQFGAGLANMVFCPPGSGVVELSSDAFWTGEYFWLAEAAGLRFGSVVGRSVPSRYDRLRGHRDEQYRHDFYRRRDFDLTIDVDAVDAAVSLQLSSPAHATRDASPR